MIADQQQHLVVLAVQQAQLLHAGRLWAAIAAGAVCGDAKAQHIQRALGPAHAHALRVCGVRAYAAQCSLWAKVLAPHHSAVYGSKR